VRTLPADKIFHVPGLSFDGISGVTPIQASKETFGHALAAQEFSSRFFSGDATPNGTLEHPGQMSDKAYERFQKSIKEGQSGLKGHHRLMLLEEGMKYAKMSMSPEDSQLLDTTKYSANQICGLFGVPPHMVGLLDRATFTNIEHQGQEFLTNCIYPWTKKWEEAINLRLVMEYERKKFYAEFVSDGYLRGDIAARTTYYSTALQNGWLSVNDIRRKENMNPVPGGDKYFRQLNLTALDAPNNDSGGKPDEN
jgi:HK97 family phage portal protein